MNPHRSDTGTTSWLRSLLLELAHRQEQLAADELAATPYWSPCPSTVLGHRAAADALRTEAELLFAAS